MFSNSTREVITLWPYNCLTFKAFARKVIRVSTSIPEKDVANEAQVVTSICNNGGHNNIIGILDHGWLRGRYKVYFIDMELASFTLGDYINYHKGVQSQSICINGISVSVPSIVRKG